VNDVRSSLLPALDPNHKVAALFVETGGIYCGDSSIEAWDAVRDARLYDGDLAVVAHPPCSRWCQLAYVIQKRWGHKVGDDGGMFASALANVRRCGGVLEHPAFTYAWARYGLPRPIQGGGWSQSLFDEGWVCEVSQAAYGHPARKLTWLYYVGEVPPRELRWDRPEPTAIVSNCANHHVRDLPRILRAEAARTPIDFRDELVMLARDCHELRSAA
jgi:hypothetical protein